SGCPALGQRRRADLSQRQHAGRRRHQCAAGRAIPAEESTPLGLGNGTERTERGSHMRTIMKLALASAAVLTTGSLALAQTEITLWHMEQPPHRVQRVQELIDAFNQANP